MRHELSVEGCAFRLRAVRDEDASFIVDLRSDPSLNRFIHAGAQRVAEQLLWLAKYYERPGDYYFVIERMGDQRPEGVIGLYDVRDRGGEWGRWILQTGSLAAIESAWMIYRVGFELLDLESVYCRTVADNANVVSFHDSCGADRSAVLPLHFLIGDRRVDAVEHRVDRRSWPTIRARLDRLAVATSRRIGRG